MFNTPEEFAKALKEYLDPDIDWNAKFLDELAEYTISNVIANNFTVTKKDGTVFIIHVKKASK